jgi:hypothetical protein
MMEFDELAMPPRAGPVTTSTFGGDDLNVQFAANPAASSFDANLFDSSPPPPAPSFDPSYSGMAAMAPAPDFFAPPAAPLPEVSEPELRYTIPPPADPPSRKRARDEDRRDESPSYKRPAVDIDDIPTYEKLSPEDLARQNRELDLLDYRQDLREWISQSLIPVEYNVDELTDDQVLIEYGKWLRVVENKQMTNTIMKGTECVVDGLEEAGKDYGVDLQGLRYTFSEQREPFQGLMSRFVRQNLRTFTLPLWAQIGIMFGSMVGGVWISNRYAAQQRAVESARPVAGPTQRELLMQRRAAAAASFASS